MNLTTAAQIKTVNKFIRDGYVLVAIKQHEDPKIGIIVIIQSEFWTKGVYKDGSFGIPL